MNARVARRLVLGTGIIAALGAVYVRRVEPWLRRWGATEAESSAALPVDDLVEPGAHAVTRAITVHAPVDDVWPWLVQIGQDRAGFYSYTWLENLVGAGMRNATKVHPEWQTRHAGDTVWLADERRWGARGRQVAALADAPRALVLVSPPDWERLQRGQKASGAWAFFLEPAGELETRLVIRSSGGAVGTHLFDAVHFLMEQKMMRGLRDRADVATESARETVRT
jgi:hypothetical protein